MIPTDLPRSGPSRLKVPPSVSENRSRAISQMLATVSFGRDKDRQNALAKWLDLVMMYPEEWGLGILCLERLCMTRVTKVSPKLMEHWVARKPTSTPTLRAGSIAMYVRFCKMFFPDNHIFSH